MNISPLKKSIIKEALIFLGAIVAFAGAAVFVMMWHDNLAEKSKRASDEVSQIIASKQGMETKYNTVMDHMDVYQESQRWMQEPGAFIDRQAVRDIFNVYRTQFFLRKFIVDMQPIADLSGEQKFMRPHWVGMRTSVKITMDATTDDDVYQLIESMQRELPGFTKVTTLKITRLAEVTPKSLVEVATQGSAAHLSALLEFDWYGLKSVDPNSKTNKYVSKKRPKRGRK